MTAVAAARDAIAAATDSLRAAGCETPQLDAEVLVAAAAGVDRRDRVADPVPARRRAARAGPRGGLPP